MYAVPDLRSLLPRIPFVVVGGVATRLYMPERMTLDINILILAEDAAVVYQALEAAAASRQGALTIGGATWQLQGGTVLDVIESSAPWAREAIYSPVEDATGLPIIRLPYLVLMKLAAGRVQDLADMTRMLGASDDALLQQVRSVVQLYAPDASEDIESMIILGEMEFEG